MTPSLIANRYEIQEALGEGAMGLVWRVWDSTASQEVALKVISHRYGATDKSVLQFQQEFRLMTQLRHPNCCAVYDYGVVEDGSPYFTMEVVPGDGLDRLVPLARDQFRPVLSQVLLALGYVHQLGFVHCDVKAANVRVRPDGTVKLMDYGLMEFARRPSGFINGTVAYIPPEVIRRGAIDQRTDLYSLGVLAYEMLTGRLPYHSTDAREVLQGHLTGVPQPPSELVPGIDPVDERIVLRLLAKNPLDRYQSAFEVLEALGVEVPSGIGGNLLTSPLMGREAEMAALSEQLERIQAHKRGGAILLSGPSGIGKSRLVEEFRFTVQLENLPCVVGQNFEQGNSPYDPFVGVLKALLPSFKQYVPRELALHAPVLVQLLPELGVLSAAAMDSPTKEKLRLQSTITELLTALASKRASIVILEDWQWADALSLELLDYVLRNLSEAPLLFLLTSRVLPEVPPEEMVVLPLSSLDTDGVERMVTSMLGTERVGEAFLRQVEGLSKGSPFFVEKLLEHLVQSQVLVNTKGRWNTHIELAPERLPKSLKGLLMWRITCLSESTQAIAHVGAVVGRNFSIELLKRVAGVSDDDLFAALASLSFSQVFVKANAGGYNAYGSYADIDAYSFAQDQIQELLYANIEADEKRRLHTAVMHALEAQLGGLPLGDVSLELVTALAHHAVNGTETDKTIVYALEAGLRSAALFANTEAEHFLTEGLMLLRDHPDGDAWKRHKLDYLQCLGDIRRLSGKNDLARENYQEAIGLAEELAEPLILGRMLTYLGRCYQVLGAFPEALASCERSLAVCRAGHDDAGAHKCLIQMGRIRYFMGDLPKAIEHAEQALALAYETSDNGQIGEALGMLGYFYVASDPDKVEEGVEYLNQSLDCLSVLGDWIALNTTYNFLGTAQNMLGDFLDAWESFQQNKKICYEIGMKEDNLFALLNLAITAYELGEFDNMAHLAQEAQWSAQQLNSRFPLGMAMTLHAVSLAYAGQAVLARSEMEAALSLARELKHKYMETQVLLYQVQILLYLGDLEGARLAGDAMQALIDETGDREPESRLHVMMGEVWGRLGDMDAARSFADKAMLASFAARAKGVQVRVLGLMAWISLQAGALNEARNLAKEALGMSTRIGSKFQSAMLQHLLGEIALATGQREAATHFEMLDAIAKELNSDMLMALAHFGLAAAEPHSGQAHLKAAEAKELLDYLVRDFDPTVRAHFLSLRERARIASGDYLGFSRPTTDKANQVVAPPRLGLNQGMWKQM